MYNCQDFRSLKSLGKVNVSKTLVCNKKTLEDIVEYPLDLLTLQHQKEKKEGAFSFSVNPRSSCALLSCCWCSYVVLFKRQQPVPMWTIHTSTAVIFLWRVTISAQNLKMRTLVVFQLKHCNLKILRKPAIEYRKLTSSSPSLPVIIEKQREPLGWVHTPGRYKAGLREREGRREGKKKGQPFLSINTVYLVTNWLPWL